MTKLKITRQYSHYPNYKDSGVDWIGSIPMTWVVLPFQRLYARFKKTGFSDKELLSVYRDRGVIIKSSRTDNYNKPSLDLSKYQLVKKNYLAINKMKAWQGSLGVSNFDGIVSPAYYVYKPISEKVSKFHHYLLRSSLYISQYERISGGIRNNQWDLDAEKMKTLEVIIPSELDQKSIVSYIDNKLIIIDKIIEQKQKLIELLQEKRSALITHAVTKGLDPHAKMKPSGIDWIGDIPEDWEILRIKTLCTISRGASPRPIDDPRYFDENGEYAWVRISDVTASSRYLEKTEQRLSEVGKNLSVPLNPGELFLSIAGSVGKPIITKIKCCIHDGFVYFKDLRVNKELLWYIFIAGEAYKGLGKLGTQLNLNTDTVGNISIPVPPKKAQQDIVNFLDNTILKYDQSIHLIESQIIQLTEYRSSLIYHAVTGKIKV